MLSAASTLLEARVKKANKYQEERNEKKLFDRSNSVAVGGLGCGTNLTQHAAINNTGHKFATTVHISIFDISIVHLAQPATCDSRYQPEHYNHDHPDNADLNR
jgi:hypothetical protein